MPRRFSLSRLGGVWPGALVWVSLLACVTGSGVLAQAVLAQAAVAQAVIDPIPAQVSSTHFIVHIDGRSSPVIHAVAGYYLLNFDLTGAVTVSVTAENAHYWDRGVEVQPMRLGIRPHRDGGTITFVIATPEKLSITRPGDHAGDSEMLFLFANPQDTAGLRMAQLSGTDSHIRFYGPGVHRGSIDAKSGDVIYLAGGAVVMGGLNLWQVHDVHVMGRGTIVYDGPQDPDHDEGWMHKPDWHGIVMDDARNIDIEGITVVVRSRTWMVQMKDSHDVTFRNVKIIGGSQGNANQDGLDWLGGGDTLIEDCFIRAADDILAMYGNWDGYGQEAMTTPGHSVDHIVIRSSVLSTSISNVVRVGWPNKVFDSHDFLMTDTDVIHMGIGSCGVPFALFEIWEDPGGKGVHTGYRFENIRLDDWYSLTQLRQLSPAIRDVSFRDIWAMDGPGMVGSEMLGDVAQVSFSGLDLGTGVVTSAAEIPLAIASRRIASEGSTTQLEPPTIRPATIDAAFIYSSGLLRPGQKVDFQARAADSPGRRFVWLFGDGTQAEGRRVEHSFPDASGTLLDGSGRFRVLLHVMDDQGRDRGLEAWSSRGVVVGLKLSPAQPVSDRAIEDSPRRVIFDRLVRVPADGGYTFTLLTSTAATLTLDSLTPVQSPKPVAQVCGSAGNATQPVSLSVALAAGEHHLRIVQDGNAESAGGGKVDPPALLWEGPGITRQVIPDAAYVEVP